MSWTINENTRVSSTQYFNASYSTTLVAGDSASADSEQQNVAGYTSGTISFTITPAPTGGGWTGSSTIEMIILGRLDTILNPFIVHTKVIPVNDPDTTFYVDWNIPLETVALRVNNDTTTSTGVEITVSSIRMQTESEGGGIGNTSTSGTTIGPGGANTQIQFNDGGIFGGASGALYDKTNTQIQLAAGTAALPMLAFSDATHPTGNYDTGLYRNVADMVAFSTGGVQKVTCSNSDTTPFINGLNVGLQTNIAGIRRLSTTDTNSWEDGHLGNSNYLYFSPRDFVGDNSPQFEYSNNSFTGPEFIRTTGNNGALLGIKLMPKGFRVKAEEGTECQLYSRNNNGFGLDVTVNLDEQSISPLPSFNSLMAGVVVSSPGSWDGAGATTTLVVSQGTVSDGTLQICFMLYDIATSIAAANGLIGARVPIERV